MRQSIPAVDRDVYFLKFLCASRGSAHIVACQRRKLRGYQGTLLVRQVGQYVIGLDKLVPACIIVALEESKLGLLLIALGAELDSGAIEGSTRFVAVGPDGRRLAKLRYGLLPVLLSGQFLSDIEVMLVRRIYYGIHAWDFRCEGVVGSQQAQRIVVARGGRQ